jgi:GNAT superfamily N-acetyltransferase
MVTQLRAAVQADSTAAGRILYDAFKVLADRHAFAPDFPSAEVASGILSMLIGHPGFYGVVADRDGSIVGSNFMDERSAICGLGPISVAPTEQNSGVGRRLMQDVLDRATARGSPGVRLLQAAYHNRSFCLYTSLGFQTREAMSVLQGPPLNSVIDGHHVRAAEPADLLACNMLCREVHDFDRDGEVMDAISHGQAMVVEHRGEVTGYTTGLGFFGHSIARSDLDLMALIGAATEFSGPGFILPSRNHHVLAWSLNNGFKLAMQMTSMTIGVYREPNGRYLSSVLF